MIIKQLAFDNLIIIHENCGKEEIKFDFVNNFCSKYHFVILLFYLYQNFFILVERKM